MKAKTSIATLLAVAGLSMALSGQAADLVTSPKHASFLNDFKRMPRPFEGSAAYLSKDCKSPRALQFQRDFVKVSRPDTGSPNLLTRPMYTGKDPRRDHPGTMQIAPSK
jgi:hypothetical protein